MDSRLKQHTLGYWEVRDKPTPAALKQYYAEKYYQTEQSNYRSSYSAEEQRYLLNKLRQRHYFVTKMLGKHEGTMLDVGCGEGFALAYFSRMGWQVEGLDFSDAGLKAMNPACANVLHTGDVYDLLDERIEARKKYDLIWLQNVLEHVLEPLDLMHRLGALVGSSGLLVVTVPNDGSPLQEKLLQHGAIDKRFWIAVPDHISYFTLESLKAIAKATGWCVQSAVADFPIDLFLLHPGSNYVQDPANGPAAHKARILLENLIGELQDDRSVAFYGAMAELGLGRCITAFMQPSAGKRELI